MPSFDIESKIDNHELSNAIDQTNKVITNRYDLKDANAIVVLQEDEIKVSANESFQLEQIIPILKENLSKRKIDLKSLNLSNISAQEKIEQAISKIITNFTTKSALKKRLSNEKSEAPPKPTT